MTDTQTATQDSYETLICYAGMMFYLTKANDELLAFEGAQSVMTPEMKSILFHLISLHIPMKKQKILGVVPILQAYKRLHPLFYRLSQTEELYYTVEDTLLHMEQREQRLAPETEDLLTRQREELVKQADRVSKTKGQNAAYETLKREYDVRRAETGRPLYSSPTLNDIEHRVLTNLTPEQRGTMLRGPAAIRDSILATLKFFNERFTTLITREKLETDTTSADARIAYLYNYDMSISGTYQRIDHFTIDNTKMFLRIKTLEENIRRNPRDKESIKQRAHLLSQMESPHPFTKLHNTFNREKEEMDKVWRTKSSAERIQKAREDLDEFTAKYASIVEEAQPAVQRAALEAREKTAMFV